MKQQVKKFWITKYALTQGIHSAMCEVKGEYVYHLTQGYRVQARIGKDAFYTRDEAVEAAKAMAMKKIKSLTKQLEKMRALAARPKFQA